MIPAVISRAFRLGGIVVLLGVTWVPRAPAQVAALDFSTVGSSAYLDTSNRMLGWQFTVTTQLDVLALGWFDWQGDGLLQNHEIGIWDVTNTATPLVSIIVPSGTGAALNDHFRYVTLGAPLTLQTGNTYRVAGFDIGTGGDAHVWDILLGGLGGKEVVGFTSDARIGLTASGGIGPITGSFGYPATLVGDGRSVLMGPNLLITAVPEPATTTLIVLISAAGAVMFARGRRMRRCDLVSGRAISLNGGSG